MIDLNSALEIACGIIAIGMTTGMAFNAIAKIERRVAVLHYHLESHCVTLNHLSEFLAKTANYQPIDKQNVE